MSETRSDQLYVHDDGTIACVDHFGAHATAEFQRTPDAELLVTPLGSWEKLSAEDIDQLAMLGVVAECETCAARARNLRKSPPMTPHEIAEALQALAVTSDKPLTEYCAAPATDDVRAVDATSYAEARVRTRHAGFVLRLSDGIEFRITVVRSR